MLSRVGTKGESEQCWSPCLPLIPSCFAGYFGGCKRATITKIVYREYTCKLIQKNDEYFAYNSWSPSIYNNTNAIIGGPRLPNWAINIGGEELDRRVQLVAASLPKFNANRCIWLPSGSEIPDCFKNIPAFDPQSIDSLRDAVDELNRIQEGVAKIYGGIDHWADAGGGRGGSRWFKPEAVFGPNPNSTDHEQFIDNSWSGVLLPKSLDVGACGGLPTKTVARLWGTEAWSTEPNIPGLQTLLTSHCYLVYSRRAQRSAMIYSQHITSCELCFIKNTIQPLSHPRTETQQVICPYDALMKLPTTEFGSRVAKFSSASEESMRRGINAYWVINCFTGEVKSRMPGSENPNFQEMASTVAFGETAIGARTICPRDGRLGSSIVDALHNKGPSDGSFKFSNKATIFLSWVWRYRLHDAVSAIRMYCEQRRGTDTAFDDKNTYIWWCFFVNNQFRILGDGQTVPTEEFEQRFAAQLQSCPKMLIMLDSFSDPTYAKRIWCIYEVYVCAKVKKPIEITLPEEASLQLADALRDIYALKAKINIDAAAAEATNKSDEEIIKKKIQQEVSFAEINKKVKKALVVEIISKVVTVFD